MEKPRATLANWRTAPFNQWAFHHVRELIPTADIPGDPDNIWRLPSRSFDFANLDIDEFFKETNTDGMVVVHRGAVVFERYAHGMTEDTPHILMSVSKSMLGLLAGVLAARGELDVERRVEAVLPELGATAYKGATIRQLLDMRAGIAWAEDYLATSGPIVAYRKASGWNPLAPGDTPSDLRSFYRELTASSGPHGGRFDYISPNTDLLGLIIERATGRRYPDLMSELIWKPMGASRNAYITVDALGAPRAAGGMCATIADLARVGQLIVEGGRRGGVQIIPEGWIEDIETNGDPQAWASGSFAAYYAGLPMHYRSKWYVLRGRGGQEGPFVFAMGIHGQNLFVDRRNAIVIAKVSSHAQPMDVDLMALTTRGALRIRKLLAAA